MKAIDIEAFFLHAEDDDRMVLYPSFVEAQQAKLDKMKEDDWVDEDTTLGSIDLSEYKWESGRIIKITLPLHIFEGGGGIIELAKEVSININEE